ncbi:hypothetical protein Lpp126_02148 [Lacticaseibacillus paracasei subsp. paracasei Lpp126]|uniref:Uncharacterized protein n=1 Tax=Lacticaseibacillus paracasei subsp. paracasei Lpp126 TaxID=1256206 RepID=S2SCY1_LACPA|nr:hypothetical protein Lpp126_02148 [Lacticaseibacillus paracasei subsp. paracasei Lpp126]
MRITQHDDAVLTDAIIAQEEAQAVLQAFIDIVDELDEHAPHDDSSAAVLGYTVAEHNTQWATLLSIINHKEQHAYDLIRTLENEATLDKDGDQ